MAKKLTKKVNKVQAQEQAQIQQVQEQEQQVTQEQVQDQEQQEQMIQTNAQYESVWAKDVPEGTAIARIIGSRKNKEGMPLLVLTIVDKRENACGRVEQITFCPWHSFIGGSDNCGNSSILIGLGNVVSAAELYTVDQRLFKEDVCLSNITWGTKDAAKVMLRGLCIEAILYMLYNRYGDGIILKPGMLGPHQYLDEVLEWLEKYRVATARDVDLITRYKDKYEDEIEQLKEEKESASATVRKLANEKAKLSEENTELKNEILRYKAAAAFSQVTIEELDKERRQIPSAKKELKKSIERALLKYKK